MSISETIRYDKMSLVHVNAKLKCPLLALLNILG